MHINAEVRKLFLTIYVFYKNLLRISEVILFRTPLHNISHDTEYLRYLCSSGDISGILADILKN